MACGKYWGWLSMSLTIELVWQVSRGGQHLSQGRLQPRPAVWHCRTSFSRYSQRQRAQAKLRMLE